MQRRAGSRRRRSSGGQGTSQREHEQQDDCADEREREAAVHVARLVMADLVGEHGGRLLHAHPLDQRVEQDDAGAEIP